MGTEEGRQKIMKDKVDILNKRLKEVVEKFEALRKCGIDEEVLVIFLHDKTGLSKRDVKNLLDSHEEFYNKLISKLTLEAL